MLAATGYVRLNVCLFELLAGCYPQAKELLITADGGGSNASRNRLWKIELQKFADEAGLAIYVHHFPPGIGYLFTST